MGIKIAKSGAQIRQQNYTVLKYVFLVNDQQPDHRFVNGQGVLFLIGTKMDQDRQYFSIFLIVKLACPGTGPVFIKFKSSGGIWKLQKRSVYSTLLFLIARTI